MSMLFLLPGALSPVLSWLAHSLRLHHIQTPLRSLPWSPLYPGCTAPPPGCMVMVVSLSLHHYSGALGDLKSCLTVTTTSPVSGGCPAHSRHQTDWQNKYQVCQNVRSGFSIRWYGKWNFGPTHYMIWVRRWGPQALTTEGREGSLEAHSCTTQWLLGCLFPTPTPCPHFLHCPMPPSARAEGTCARHTQSRCLLPGAPSREKNRV